ncbi:hypothetical protein PAECIP111893_04176 [Paenibacillus plantiphilus]|uniref:50S ribosomal protein L11 methyltransferase n=1 Tax=Paenibacillus plantiphilus TaxID=2905650 RepID=A0ABN8GZU0_9BACL|nr:hypothetical protein [Paenibacillus plantiphilus]CAH1216801.1 hypothetical protein PAECIP111893_04176 [Paenibacillus plantiphilus]
MSKDTALLFQFADTASASSAAETLQELGYEAINNEVQKVHVHLQNGDLTSALEIVQAYGGSLIGQSAIHEAGDAMMVDEAYGLDAIPIPAHIVNEDWIAQEENTLHNHNDDAPGQEDFLPDNGTYSYFSGDVHT